MYNVTYDLTKLRYYDEIDVPSAMNNFSSQQAFFDQLASFAGNGMYYLRQYNANQLITQEETLATFISDLQNLRESLVTLGMNEAANDLNRLASAVYDQAPDALTQELYGFFSRMEKITSIVNDAKEEASPMSAPAGKPIILAVDDMPLLLSSVVQMLQPRYTVMAVTTAQAALKAVEKQTPSLFLLDIEMPDMSGYELAAELRSNTRFEQTPIIFLTAKGTRDDVVLAIRHGGNDYIIKPVDQALLLNKIEKLMA